jgi:hypothetical protein
MPGCVVGYDVMVFVGLARFLRYRQREEIQAELFEDHGLPISTGEVSALSLRFARYLGVTTGKSEIHFWASGEIHRNCMIRG